MLRKFARAIVWGWIVLYTSGAWAQEPGGEPKVTEGPMIGHTTSNSADIWARVSQEGEYTLIYRYGAEDAPEVKATATKENDLCLIFHVTDSKPNLKQRYRIAYNGKVLFDGHGYTFTTGPRDDEPYRVEVTFGSCASDEAFPEQRIWAVARNIGTDVMVLLGDTPYIDSTDLETQREKYRQFHKSRWRNPLFRRMPIYATWDDHDFGRNDTDGRLEGKENSRKAFIEYHANATYGDGENGIYTKFRRGPIEVFLLDTRWFANTEPSPVDPDKPTLLGAAQWKWIRNNLVASTATFKVLASGMIWNGAVRPGKKDHWETYSYERDALFEFIGAKKISGVVLVGGDIHRSRAIRHATQETVGYDLYEFISSPMANTVIEAANVPIPGLLHDVGEPHTIITLEANTKVQPAKLTAACFSYVVNKTEEKFRIVLTADMLTAKP